MCSSPYWQVGQSWFREKLSPANREQKLSRWADFAKNCLPRIGSKVLPRFREKYRALGRQKNGVQHATAIYPILRYTRPRYIGLTLYWFIDIGFLRQSSKGNFTGTLIIPVPKMMGFILLKLQPHLTRTTEWSKLLWMQYYCKCFQIPWVIGVIWV